MKRLSIDIANFLSAYRKNDVKEGIRLWANQYVMTKGRVLAKLREDGWYPVGKEKPEGREYYFIFGEYWVQDEKIHAKLVNEQVRLEQEKIKRRQELEKRFYNSTKQKTDLSDIRKTELKCPTCGGELFRQPICPGCEEGRKGFRVRLICGEDADHEFLV